MTTAGPAASRRSRRNRWAADLAAALLLVVLVPLLYRDALALWWQGDDFFNLLYVSDWAPAEYALDPAVWRRLPFRMLTPLLFLSLDADLALFGVAPRPFYVHQLAALALAAIALFALLRRWLGTGWALFGAVVLLLGPPVASAPPLLPVRHYLEGLTLALLAIWLFVGAVRATRAGPAALLATLSALVWLAASLAKEVYAPLVLLLPLMPEGPPATRLRRLLPHALALGAYLGYRRFLLGEWFGGYGWAVAPADLPGLALALPARLAREMVGASPAAGIPALLLLLGAAAAGAARRRGAAPLLAAGALAAVLPVLPVSSEVAPRYAIVAWAAVAVAAPFGLAGRRAGAVAAAAALALTLTTSLASWRQELARAQRAGREAQALLTLPAGDALRHPGAMPASLRELRRFAPRLLAREVRASFFQDDAYLCLVPAQGRLWEYDDSAERVVEISRRRPRLRRAACAALGRQEPLAARFASDGEVLRWQLGPHRDGRWAFVLDDGVEAFAVPRRGGFQVPLRELTLRVRHESPAGRVVYSPPLRVDLTRGAWSWRQP